MLVSVCVGWFLLFMVTVQVSRAEAVDIRGSCSIQREQNNTQKENPHVTANTSVERDGHNSFGLNNAACGHCDWPGHKPARRMHTGKSPKEKLLPGA